MRTVFLLAFIFIANYTSRAWAQENYSFISPDSSTTIFVRVDSSNFAEYYINDENGEKKIFERNLRYEPMVSWIDNNYAEFFLPTGSPNYTKVFYSKKLNTVSDDFPLAINFDSESTLVATLDFDKINFHRAFGDSLITDLEIPGLEPISFLVFCNHSSSFNKNGLYEFSYKCGTQKELNSDFPSSNKFLINVNQK